MERRIFILFTFLLLAASCIRVQPHAALDQVHHLVHDKTTSLWNIGSGVDSSAEGQLLDAVMSMNDAVQFALANNQGLQAQLAELSISQADLAQASRIKNPVVEGQIRFSGEGDMPIEVGIKQDIMDLLLISQRRQAAAASYEAAKFKAANQIFEFIAEVQAAYIRMVSATQTVKLRTANLKSARAAAELSQRQKQAGNISSLVLENQLAQFEQAELDLNRGENELTRVREQFIRLLGITNHRGKIQVMADLPEIPASEPELTKLQEDVLAHRLDYMATDKAILAAKQSAKLARYASFPAISLGVHYEHESDGDDTIGPGIELALPIFDRGRASVAKARGRIEQTIKEQQALRIDILSRLREVYNRLSAAKKIANYYQTVIVPRRERIVDQTHRHYNYMLQGTYELLQAKQNWVAARNELIEALQDYWLAKIELQLVTGFNEAARIDLPDEMREQEPSDTSDIEDEHHH